MSDIAIKEPETKDLEVSSADMLSKAAALVVSDDQSFTFAAEMLLEIKRRGKMVEERFAESVSAAHKAHKALTKLRDSVLGPFLTAEGTIKRKVGDYQVQQEQVRRIEAEKARKAAEQKAEAERIAKATEQMDKGDLKACEQTLEAPLAPVQAVPTTPEPPKVAGVSYRDEAKFSIDDADAVPRAYCVPDEKKIRSMVKALGKNANIPGVRVWMEKVVSVGGR